MRLPGLTIGFRRNSGAVFAVLLAAGSIPGFGLNPTPAFALCRHHKKDCCERVVAPSTRTYVVRTYEGVDDREDDGTRTIEVVRTTPPPSEIGRSRALGTEQRSRGMDRAGEPTLPLLLKTAKDADGNRVPQLGGTETAARSLSTDDQKGERRVVVRSSAPSTSGTTRSVVKRYVTTPASSRTVSSRSYREIEPTIILREVPAKTVVREVEVPIVVLKKGWCH